MVYAPRCDRCAARELHSIRHRVRDAPSRVLHICIGKMDRTRPLPTHIVMVVEKAPQTQHTDCASDCAALLRYVDRQMSNRDSDKPDYNKRAAQIVNNVCGVCFEWYLFYEIKDYTM